jgi:hypothetical protein
MMAQACVPAGAFEVDAACAEEAPDVWIGSIRRIGTREPTLHSNVSVLIGPLEPRDRRVSIAAGARVQRAEPNPVNLRLQGIDPRDGMEVWELVKVEDDRLVEICRPLNAHDRESEVWNAIDDVAGLQCFS